MRMLSNFKFGYLAFVVVVLSVFVSFNLSASPSTPTKASLPEGAGAQPIECSDSERDCAGICFGSAIEDCDGQCNGSAIVDDCGDCNGNNERKDCNGICDGPAVFDCNGDCDGGLVFDECGQCGGDGASCKDCVYNLRLFFQSAALQDAIQGEARDLTCLETFFEDLDLRLDDYFQQSDLYSDFQKSQLRNALDLFISLGLEPLDFITCSVQLGQECYEAINVSLSDALAGQLDGNLLEFFLSLMNPALDEGDTLFLNSNCEPVSFDESEHLLCGNLDVLNTLSPLSLFWEPEGSFAVNERLVNFRLDPNSDAEWSTWRTSSRLPLVVWDPEHRGEITSAMQLFGNWTFGGRNRQYSGLIGASSNPMPWKNGYEALKTLDVNRDEKVSGAELEPLGLWFDHNQNGRSEPGEVVPIEKAGVSALYYQPDRSEKFSQDIYATKGYSRVVNGVTEFGVSVDWYGEAFKTYLEGLQLTKARALIDSGSKEVAVPSIEQEFKGRPNNELRKPFLGLWRWRADLEAFSSVPHLSGQDVGGYLLLTKAASGVQGLSLSEFQLEENGSGAKSAIGIGMLSGFVAGTNPIDATVQFRVSSKNDGLTLTRASVSDGLMLGSSKLTLPRPNGTTLTLTYEWKAEEVPISKLLGKAEDRAVAVKDKRGLEVDDCGVPGGRNKDKDFCGVCFGDNKDKDLCGVCFGEDEALDRCGQCFGENRAMDECGECFGPGKGLCGCPYEDRSCLN